ncbi:hypothetical protein [Niallia sp. 01092]|uniref:hypothetical protein n=1 Tax=unclassified Niallia TaxID=2837522 RepID=UPI003FCF782E
MKQKPLTYIEKVENLYILMETRQMLQSKLQELQQNNQSYQLIEEDLRKIDKEILSYTDGQHIQDPEQMITSSIFNPAAYFNQSN